MSFFVRSGALIIGNMSERRNREREAVETKGMKLCAVCAWRRDCLKKYKFQSSNQPKCLDFSRDLTIPEEKDEEKTRKNNT